MAAADADDRGYDLKMSYVSIFVKSKMRHETFVDPRGLFGTITMVHEPREYPLKKIVKNMPDSFEGGGLNGVNWIDGHRNLSNCRTKCNTEVSNKLNSMLATGFWAENTNASTSA